MDFVKRNMDEVIYAGRDDANASFVSSHPELEHEEEQKARKELYSELNYDKEHWSTKKHNIKTGDIDFIKIRKISNGENKYKVKDALYSYHYSGVTSVWQFGVCAEDKDVTERRFSILKDGKEEVVTFKKEKGTYEEHGDSRDSGQLNNFNAIYTEWNDNQKFIPIPEDLDLSDTNAIRYELRNNSVIAHFMDKYVIVKPEEKQSYLDFVKSQPNCDKDELARAKRRCIDNKLAILRNKFVRQFDEGWGTSLEEKKLATPLKKIEKFISDKLFGKVKE